MERKDAVKIIEELADRITEELESQLAEEGDEEALLGSDSEGDECRLLLVSLWYLATVVALRL